MSKKIGGAVALVGMCAVSLFLLNCGNSSNRPSGVLYVLTQGINGSGNSVSLFTIDLYSGNLSLLESSPSTCPTPPSGSNSAPCGLPLDIVVEPPGATAFVLDQGVATATPPVAPAIYSYTVNTGGILSAPGATPTWNCISPAGTPCSATNSYPDTAVAMVRDAAGQFLFVIDQGTYPSPTTCPSIATPATNATQAADFVGCPSISVYALTQGSTSLTLVSQSSTYQSPFFLSKIPTALSTITFTPSSGTPEELLFVTNNYDLCTIGCLNGPPPPPRDNTVSVYSVSSSGILTEQLNSPYVVAAADPISVQAVNTNPPGESTGGVFVYVGSQNNNAGQLYPFQLCTVQNTACSPEAVQDNLMLPLAQQPCNTPPCTVPPTSAGSYPGQMVLDPTNNFLYVASSLSNQIFGFRINTTAGKLTPLSPAYQPAGTNPVSMVLLPSVSNTGQSLTDNNYGQFLYVSNNGSSNITGFTLSTTSGSMSSPITALAPAAPSGIAVY